MKATLLYKCQDETGESATWLAKHHLFLWVDIDRGVLHVHNPLSGEFKDVKLPDMVSTIVPWTENRLLLALKGRVVCYDIQTGSIEYVREVEARNPMLRPNDGKASPDGRWFLGVMHLSDHRETGALFRVDPDFSMTKVLDKQCIPNGIVWSADGTKMFYADSGRRCIEQYSYDLQTGSIGFERVAVRVPEELGVPDGMTIDANGRLWVAHWGGYGVYVWNPENGQLEDKVEVPVPNVASCTFDGHGNLYITTARAGLSEAALSQYPLSGSLFVAKVTVLPGENHYSFIDRNTTP